MGELSVCLLSTFYPPFGFGGDAVQVQRLARGLVRRGHRVRVVHAAAAHRLLGGTVPTAEPDHGDVEVIAAPMGRAAAVGTYLSGQPLGYRRQLEELASGFDVVHVNNPSLLGGPGALRAGEGIRLYTTHEHWLVCPTHVLFRNNREVCTTRTCVSCTLRHHRPPQPWRATTMLERALRGVDALLCPSEFTAAVHRQHFPDARIEVLPLAAPIPETPAGPPPDPADRPKFLYAGRLEPIKGVDRLVAAFPDVQGADLVVAGAGSLAPALEAMAHRHPQIQLVGQRTEPEILELCRRARAVVVPSAGYETFGGVAVEAMAVGTPVVVRDLGPLPELTQGGGGLTFSDDAALVEVLQRLVDEPDLGPRLGAKALEDARLRYSEERFFSRYFEIIGELASGRGDDELASSATAAAQAEELA